MAQVQELKAEARDGTRQGPGLPGAPQGPDPRHRLWRQGRARERQLSMPAPWSAISRRAPSSPPCSCWMSAARRPASFPRQVQLDPVSDRPVHVDFMRLAEGATVRLEIPVHFKGQGESPGLKKGGVLNIVRHEMDLICPADNIPNDDRWSMSPSWTSTSPSISRRSPCRKASSRSSAAATSPSAPSSRPPA